MSTLKADTIVASDGTSPVTLTKQIATKAYVQYDHETATVNGSLNQSSVTDLATGNSGYNFTNNMSNNDYSVSPGVGNVNTSNSWPSRIILFSNHQANYDQPPTSSLFKLQVLNNSGSLDDYPYICHQVAGDLA